MKNYRIIKRISKELNVKVDEVVPTVKNMKKEIEKERDKK